VLLLRAVDGSIQEEVRLLREEQALSKSPPPSELE
jgi:hypothetical protein